jgi:hypothetical protein
VTGNADNDFFTYTVTDGNGCQKSGNITVTVVKQGGVAQNISSSGGVVTINFAGIPNYSYDVQRSSDSGFSTYTTVLTTNAPAFGVFIFTEAMEGSAYYRLMQH